MVQPSSRGCRCWLSPRPAIIPDLMAAVPMSPCRRRSLTVMPGPFLPSRRLLWDVKINFGDSRYQRPQWVRERQSGAVASRALGVWRTTCYMRGCLMGGSVRQARLLIQERLPGYSRVRALVFGRYGEASADLHALLAAVASARASRVSRVAAGGGGGPRRRCAAVTAASLPDCADQ